MRPTRFISRAITSRLSNDVAQQLDLGQEILDENALQEQSLLTAEMLIEHERLLAYERTKRPELLKEYPLRPSSRRFAVRLWLDKRAEYAFPKFAKSSKIAALRDFLKEVMRLQPMEVETNPYPDADSDAQ